MSSEWFTLKSVYDKHTKNSIDVSRIKVDKFTSMYSNTKIPTYRLFFDDKVIKKNNTFMCEYECKSCNRLNVVTLNNIARKLNKGMLKCSTCKEYDVEKREKQSLYMQENGAMIRLGMEVKEKSQRNQVSLIEKLNSNYTEFNNEDDDFKVNYFRKHLTSEEFERIQQKIVSFQHDKFSTMSNFVYYPCVKISNQTKYNPYLYDKTRDVLEKITYINFRCENCDDVFFNRDIYIQKNKYKILCNNCNFTNNVFKIRTSKNILGEKLQYQSKFELKFICFCNENGIVVKNGPIIPYEFNGTKKYKVDFSLPDIQLLVEIKDNHIWHKQNLQSGKWQAKQNAALQFVKSISEHHRFMMIFPKNYLENTTSILKMANKI